MMNNMIPFPGTSAGMSMPAKSIDAFLSDEERAAAENLAQHYAEQAAREAAHCGNAREISLDAFASRLEYQERKRQPTQNAEGVRVGDLFYGSWGYEQTNVDFFQVVALKGKHTVLIREIAGDYISGYLYQGNVRPCRDAFLCDDVYTVRTKMSACFTPPRLLLNHPNAHGYYLGQISDDREIGYSSYY